MLKNLYIETTNICNLTCAFCPGTNREKKFMTADEFDYILGKTKNFAEFFYLHVLGEPLINPAFPQFIKSIEKHGVKIKLTTNGTLLEKYIDIIINCPNIKSVNISLTACSNFTGDEKTGYITSMIKNAEILSKNSVPVILRYWRKDGGDFDLISGILNERFKIKIDKNSKNTVLAKNLIFDCADEFIWPVNSTGGKDTDSRCLGLVKQAAILCSGDVVPCCLDSEGQMVLGNIFKNDFNDILNCETAKNIRNGFLNNKAYTQFCKTCVFKNQRL